MPITAVQNLGGREADAGSQLDMRLRRRWLVKTNSRYHSEANILQDAIVGYGLPIPFVSRHPDNIAYLCKRLRARMEASSPLHWIAEAEYDTAPVSPNKEEEDKPPLDRRAKISWSTVKYQKAIEKDRDGKAILNSAGDYFDPPPLKDLSRWSVSIAKNMPAIPTWILEYPDALNNGTFELQGLTVDKNAAKLMSISISDLQKEGDDEYYTLQYTLEFDKDKWKGIYLNQGYYYLDTSSGPPYNRLRCKVNGKDAVSPQLLDSDGSLIDNPSPDNATFEEYNIYSEKDFSVLPME